MATGGLERSGRGHRLVRRCDSFKVWDLVTSRATQAREANALKSVGTDVQLIFDGREDIEDGKIEFIVRKAHTLQDKSTTVQTTTKDPFAPPYDPNLFVTELGDSHVVLLNKFNVVNNHVILATKDYQSQNESLHAEDLELAYNLAKDLHVLVFYNCGPASGASQRHKHIQIVPLPLYQYERRRLLHLPIDRPIMEYERDLGLCQIPQLDFRHACYLPSDLVHVNGTYLENCYHELLKKIGINHTGPEPLPSYNFLLTKRWMLLVPRTNEKSGPVSINALGFAGSLFAKDDEQLQYIKERGPMQVLRDVTFPPDPE